MIERARKITLQQFGRTIKLYAPLYLSSFCRNQCSYCNFNAKNPSERRRLSINEAVNEARILFDRGIRHILLVAGEDPSYISVKYLAQAIRDLKAMGFCSVSIEVAPLSIEEYTVLVEAGLDGVTIYQETYDREAYQQFHKGSKADYDWRFGTPERAGRAGVREIGIGFLLGLADFRQEAKALTQHIEHLIKICWQSQLYISFPRIRRIERGYEAPHPVSDQELIELITGLRITFPHVDLALSTRENPALRDKLIGFGITKMSAGSCTAPGGYSKAQKVGQFFIEDDRSVAQVAQAVTQAGYEPVFKDWE